MSLMNTTSKPLISVIVPIYMIDRYLGLCIESILKQTYENLEIILVDDGSRDRCPEICDLYASKDQRIRVIHKHNGGLVSARKAGLQQSRGEFISYVDGDDWIEPSFIEGLYSDAEKHNADMVCAGFTKDLFSKSSASTNAIKAGKIYEGLELVNLWKSMLSYGSSYYRPGISTYVWNKLFRRDILLKVQSQVDNRITLGEDAAVTYPALLFCERVFVSDNTDYHYRQREDSMLKQSTGYIIEAQKLLYLYEYMMNWAASTPSHLALTKQVIDYVLSIAIIRSGGRLLHSDFSNDFSIFDKAYYGKNVVIYSAGTFGQQLMNRFKENRHCNVVSWVDDDYWEYRRCCLNVDSVQTLTSLYSCSSPSYLSSTSSSSFSPRFFDYVLIAAVDGKLAEKIKDELIRLGIPSQAILSPNVPESMEERDTLLNKFLDINTLKTLGRSKGDISHA